MARTGILTRVRGAFKLPQLYLDFGSASGVGGLREPYTNTRISVTWTNAGAPTGGGSGTFAGLAQPGDRLTDTTNGNIYLNTNTAASPTWALIAGNATVNSSGAAISAAGTNRGTATALTNTVNNVGTVAASTGVVLQAPNPNGPPIVIINGGANTLAIYAPGSATIDGTAGSTGTTLSTAHRLATLYPISATAYISALGGAVSS